MSGPLPIDNTGHYTQDMTLKPKLHITPTPYIATVGQFCHAKQKRDICIKLTHEKNRSQRFELVLL